MLASLIRVQEKRVNEKLMKKIFEKNAIGEIVAEYLEDNLNM